MLCSAHRHRLPLCGKLTPVYREDLMEVGGGSSSWRAPQVSRIGGSVSQSMWAPRRWDARSTRSYRLIRHWESTAVEANRCLVREVVPAPL
jgi:hypothetical protein